LEGSQTRQIAQGLIEALSGERQMPSAEVCQNYVKQNYDWQVIASQMRSVYEEVLNV